MTNGWQLSWLHRWRVYVAAWFYRWKQLRLVYKLLVLLSTILLAMAVCLLPYPLFRDPVSWVLLDRQGRLLNASIADDGQWRFPEQVQVPEKFEACILTFEDRRFYKHPGVDVSAFVRASWHNLQAGSVREGGSTLTMQVVRLWKQHQERSVTNKLIEAYWAVRLEFSYSKREILALYACHAPFGGNVVGLEAAAWRYYGREANKLSWGEMAALAVLPNAPALVHPGRNRQRLLEKRNRLLDALRDAGYINAETAALSKEEPLPGAPKALPQEAPHLLMRVRQEAESKQYEPIFTSTLDYDLQIRVNQVLASHQQLLLGNGINNIAALVADVATGQVLAYVGNHFNPSMPDWESNVDVLNAPRSPGSTLKPLLYAAALSDGLILPRSLLADIPTQFGGYSPENFDRQYLGAVPAADALARSLNIPAVRLLQQYKHARFYELLQAVGIRTLTKPPDHYGLSMVLGGCEVTPWELAGVYASLARMISASPANTPAAVGRYFHPLTVSLYPTRQERQQTALVNLDASSAWLTTQAMQEVMRPGEEALWQQFGDAPQVSWKTGTSFGFRDGWSIGINSKHVVLVWTGNADGEGRAGLIGVQTAAPVMFDIFRLLPRAPALTKPESSGATVIACRHSGFRAGPDCPDVDTIYAGPRALQVSLCAWHTSILTNADASFRYTADCSDLTPKVTRKWFVLPPGMAYYYQAHNPFYLPLPPYAPGCKPMSAEWLLDIIYPQEGAQVMIPREWSGEAGKLVFTATHQDVQAKLFWSLDEQPISTTSAPHQISIAPPPGVHVLVVVDAEGNRVTRRFTVRARE